MAAYNLLPVFNDAPFIDKGVPASGYKCFLYLAGSSTKITTYQDSAGSTPNANPILTRSDGYPASGGSVVEVWVAAGISVKAVFALPTDTDPPTSPLWTRDNLTAINDVVATASEWIAGPTPTYISGTQFSLVGDQTPTFTVGRRIKATVTAGTVYGTITVSAHTTLTTVTVVIDSGALDSGLSAVSYGLLGSVNESIPEVMANTFRIDDNSDPTKKIAFSAASITTGNTRTITMADGAVTLTAGTMQIKGGATPTRQVFTSGTGTYTTPAGATRINIRMVGAGGGSGGSGTANQTDGGKGGDTTFATFTATGGAKGTQGNAATIGAGGAGGGTSGSPNIGITGGMGSGGFVSGASLAANTSGGAGGNSAFGGGAGAQSTGNGFAGATNSGGGASGANGDTATFPGGGGGAGGYVETAITTPSATYSYGVGAAGTAGSAGTSGSTGALGGSGIIIVDEFYT